MRAQLRFHIQDVTLTIMVDALDIKWAVVLSYWRVRSYPLPAPSAVANFSENRQHGRAIAGLKIIDPFP